MALKNTVDEMLPMRNYSLEMLSFHEEIHVSIIQKKNIALILVKRSL